MSKRGHFFTTPCTTTDEFEAQAAVGLWGGGLGGGQTKLTSLLHFVLQLTKLKPKPPWASGTVALEGVKKGVTSLLHLVLQLTNLKPKPPWAFGTVVLEGVKRGSLLYYTLYYN